MDYAPEEYTRFYIVQALFRLLRDYEYEKISVTDIAEKAGVGRATFYRYFKRKEDIVIYYFDHHAKEFIFNQRFYPRCKDDYVKNAAAAFSKFKENKEQLKLIRKAHLEYLYLEYLNSGFIKSFESDHCDTNQYAPYLYAGMLFNVSMAWLDNDCDTPIETLAQTMVDAIYFEQ